MAITINSMNHARQVLKGNSNQDSAYFIASQVYIFENASGYGDRMRARDWLMGGKGTWNGRTFQQIVKDKERAELDEQTDFELVSA